jgi:hypothetical protein
MRPETRSTRGPASEATSKASLVASARSNDSWKIRFRRFSVASSSRKAPRVRFVAAVRRGSCA